jgi:hypothetical protein
VSVKSYTEQIERLARAFDALRPPEQKLEIVVSIQGDTDRRESILRNQNDGELDALARKLKSRLGL